MDPKKALPWAGFMGQFWKIVFLAEHFTPKTTKMTKFRSLTKIFERTVGTGILKREILKLSIFKLVF